MSSYETNVIFVSVSNIVINNRLHIIINPTDVLSKREEIKSVAAAFK